MNYDAYITGFYDPTSPINQPETEAEKLTYAEFLENELNQHLYKGFLGDYKDTVRKIYQSNKRIAEIEENKRLLPFDSDEQQELIEVKKKLTKLIDLL